MLRVDTSLLIHGDNVAAMTRLLPNYAGKVDLVYIDPPFNTGNKFYFSEDKVSHISPVKNEVAYSDDMPFQDYLSFLKDRLFLIHRLLSERGTLYFHIDLKVGHYVKVMLDGIFGMGNFLNDISRVKSNPKNFSRKAYGNFRDMILVYAKNAKSNIFNDVLQQMTEAELEAAFPKIDESGRRYCTVSCSAPGETLNGDTGRAWNGRLPPKGRHWAYSPETLNEMDEAGLIEWSLNHVPRIRKYADEHKGKKYQDVWLNWKDPYHPKYPTEKNNDMLDMIVQQSSLPDSLIMDCFCGSGAFLASGMRHGRRVIGIDQSDIAIKVSAERLELKDTPIVRL